MFEVVPTETFLNDVRDTLAYLLGVLDSPKAAKKLMGGIDRVVGLLEVDPLINAVSQGRELEKRGIRVHFVGNYLMAYVVQGSNVLLLRLLHQSQAYDNGHYWDELG